MARRWLHGLLAILVLAQPVSSALASASSIVAGLDVGTSMSMEMPDCHDAETLPDCCDDMDSTDCGMDCGTASPALSQPLQLAKVIGHGVFETHAGYAPPDHPPYSILKPPRTS